MVIVKLFIVLISFGFLETSYSQSNIKSQNVEKSNDTIILYNENDYYKKADIANCNLFIKIDESYVYYNRKKNRLDYNKRYKDVLDYKNYGKYILLKEDKSYDCIYFKNGKLKQFKEPIFNKYKKEVFVSKNGKEGILNKDLELILPTEYDYIDFMLKANGRLVYKDDKVGFFHNKLILEAKYDSIANYVFRSYHREADVFVYPWLNGKMGVFDFNSNEVLPIVYDKISPYFAAGFLNVDTEKPFLFVVKKDGKFGILNIKNEILVPIEFDNEEDLDEKINELYGIKN